METCGRDAAVTSGREERDYDVEHLPPLLEDEVRETLLHEDVLIALRPVEFHFHLVPVRGSRTAGFGSGTRFLKGFDEVSSSSPQLHDLGSGADFFSDC